MNLLLHNPHQSQHSSLKNYKNIARTLTSTDIAVLGKLFKIHAYYTNINVSQLRIATELGIHPVTVCKIIAKLVRYKFISKTVAKFKQTCTYFLNPIFNSLKSVSILSEVLGFLKKSFSLSQFIHFKQKYSTANLTISSLSINNLPVVSKTKICKYTDRNGENFYKKFPKRKENESMEGIEVSAELRAVTQMLNLTKWGQLKLSVFPDHIIKQCLNELRLAKSVKKSFGWFISVAIKNCDRERIKPNWEQYDFLKKKYQQPADAKMVIASERSCQSNKTIAAPSHRLWEPPVKLSPEERIKFLEKEIANCQLIIANPPEYMFSLGLIHRALSEHIEELRELNEAYLYN